MVYRHLNRSGPPSSFGDHPLNYPPTPFPTSSSSSHRPNLPPTFGASASSTTNHPSSSHRLEATSGAGSRKAEHGYEADQPSPSSVGHRVASGASNDMDAGSGNRTLSGSKRSAAEDENDGEAGPAGVGRRKKKAVSCESCRRRKLKCDRGWPCGACRDRNEAHMCKWEGGTRPQAPGRDQDNAPLLMRMDRIEDMLAAIADRVGLQQDYSSPASRISHSHTSSSADPVPPGGLDRGGARAGTVEASAERKSHLGGKSVIATGWQSTSAEEGGAELSSILDTLPDTATVRKLCRYYFDEVDYMHYSMDEDEFWQRGMREHEELRLMYRGPSQGSGSAARSRTEPDSNVRAHLQFLSLVLTMCGLSLLFSDHEEFADVTQHIGTVPAHGFFIDGAQRAFNASDPFEEPTLMSIRVLILQLWFISAVRGPSVGAVLFAQAAHQMYALELDLEPPESMPAAERADRLQLFHCLVIIDWFSVGAIKRSYTIREEPIKHPYLFSRKRLSDRLSTMEPPLSPHQWLKLELSRLNRRGADRAAMTEADAYNATIEIQKELDDLYMSLPPEYDAELTSEREVLDSASFHRLGVLVAVATQLISLHKRYYIQGWLDPTYRTSRDICFTSARRICSLFRKVFSYNLSVHQIMSMDMAQVQATLAKRQNFTSRLWFIAHASVGASLLLQHHYALMEAHPGAAGPNADRVRLEIVDDLRITKRLLVALSSHSQIARSGVAVLTKPCLAADRIREAVDQGDVRALPRGYEDEVTRKRRANLAMDLQSITDVDAFSPRRFKRRGEQGSKAVVSSMAPPSQEHTTDGARNGILSHNGSTPTSNVYNASTSSSTPQSSNAANRNEMAEMEALLQSTLSTDLYTGLPLAPEVSFQRQADRIGGTQPYLPSGLMGPMSPFTSSVLRNWEALGVPNNGASSDHMAHGDHHMGQQQPIVEPTNSGWF